MYGGPCAPAREPLRGQIESVQRDPGPGLLPGAAPSHTQVRAGLRDHRLRSAIDVRIQRLM